VRRPEAGQSAPAILAVFNLGREPIDVDLGDAPATRALQGHGFEGSMLASRTGQRLTLPAHAAYFGEIIA
jgi:alpha-glucosidase